MPDDISKHSSSENPGRFRRVVKQQGRIELDDDFNEQALLSKASIKEIIENAPARLALAKDIQAKEAAAGYKILFDGSSTTKTKTAELVAKQLKRELYKVDLTMIVSKYIGETEKNLEQLFARAEDKGWVLFFDEADALFGKRTNVKDAHDKYANQEIAYLLQRIEAYPGIVILAVNNGNDIEKPRHRMFHSVVTFPLPG
jgi:SpoVK/Ycf46/Vps4 family AAA+-type ATPase